jgi:hypothetical protein
LQAKDAEFVTVRELFPRIFRVGEFACSI